MKLATFATDITFLSTSPLRGTTDCGGDREVTLMNFYPRPPCGERLGSDNGALAPTMISIHVPLAGNDI